MIPSRHTFAWVLAVLLGACEAPAPEPDALATFEGGRVEFRRAEQRVLARVRAASQPLAAAELRTAYRQAAERLAIGDLLLAGRDLDHELAEHGDLEPTLRRNAVVELYVAQRLEGSPRWTVSDEEVDAFFEERRDRFEHGERRDVWHLFRRARQGESLREVTAYLAELKRRVETGADFAQLAREHSDSENRTLGGRVGWLGEGRLPYQVEERVFALEAGEVSAPIEVGDGAALFLVRRRIGARKVLLEEVRPTIRRHLLGKKREERLDELVDFDAPPADSLIPEGESLPQLLAESDADTVVLRIGEFELSAAELRSRLEPAQLVPAEPALETPVERTQRAYRSLVREHLLYHAAQSDGFTEERATEITELLHQRGARALTERLIEERMEDKVLVRRAEVEAFHRENHFLYQSDLRLRLLGLSVPIESSRTARRMEEIQRRLVAGEMDLGAAAEALGGRLYGDRWVSFEGLTQLEPKVAFYLLELDGTGFTQAFQLNRELHVLEVVEREEPRVLPLEEVLGQVQGEYLARHRQKLYREVMDEALGAAGFEFHPEVLERALAPSA